VATHDDGTTVIAPPGRVEGLLSSQRDLRIEGELKGTVRANGKVLVAESGAIEATVHGQVVVVAGSVTGDVLADEKIELQPSAVLRGDITAPRILIQEGATFEGQVFMRKPDDTGSPTKAGVAASQTEDEDEDEDRPERAADAKTKKR
jgi:cytoskeletal protein CcmA (bactofilin family)